MTKKRKATPKAIAISERCALALDLRKQGGSFREIAQTMRAAGQAGESYDHAQAWRDINAELKRLNEENRDSVEEMRQLQLEQLNALWAKQYEQALDGDGWALDRCLAIQARIGTLYGLNAATKTQQELSGPGGTPLQANPVVIYIPDNGRDKGN